MPGVPGPVWNWSCRGHPAIEICSLETHRVKGHFCGVTQGFGMKDCFGIGLAG
jgi:hypothetical protein